MADQKMEKRPGDANAITRDYFDSLLIEMRHFDGVLPSTELNLYGETFKTPVMMAALSHLDNIRENGMAEMARGALAAGSVNWAGMGSESELEAITATRARTIKIIKPYQDNAIILQKIRHAEKCGCLAIGMDLDHSFNSKGQYDVVRDLRMKPKSMAEIKSYVQSTRLPFIIKGVLSKKDAEKCLEAGVQGIVVSHHHGILDYAIPPLMILPEIVKVINRQMPVFVDCGILSGLDVFKALALGADAVSAGRIVMGPLAAEGAEGVRSLVDKMTAELAGAMARTGSPDIKHIDPSLIWHNGQQLI